MSEHRGAPNGERATAREGERVDPSRSDRPGPRRDGSEAAAARMERDDAYDGSPDVPAGMRWRDDMTFPMEEYVRRLRELRERMAERDLDVAIITDPENLMYLTDHQTTGYSYFQALVVPLDREPFMITRKLEETNVVARTWVEITRTYGDTGDAIETLWHALNEFGLVDKCIGYERSSYFFPFNQQERMRETFFQSRFVDCFGIVEKGRIVKSDAEIAVMRRAARATEIGVEAGIRAVASGVTENDIAAEVHYAMFKAGGEYPAVAPYITSGPRTTIGHATWEGRTIGRDEVVFLEVGGCYRRYHAAMMRTVYVGTPPPAIREAEAVVAEANQAVREETRPGMTAADLDKLVRDITDAKRVGGGYQITRAGYSIGIAFAPSWDEGYIMSLKPGDQRPLEPNMTFHVIPWLFGIHGTMTVGLSETIRITETGCESFFSMPRKLYLAD